MILRFGQDVRALDEHGAAVQKGLEIPPGESAHGVSLGLGEKLLEPPGMQTARQKTAAGLIRLQIYTISCTALHPVVHAAEFFTSAADSSIEFFFRVAFIGNIWRSVASQALPMKATAGTVADGGEPPPAAALNTRVSASERRTL